MFTMRKKLLLVLAMLVPLIGFSVEKQKTASVRWGTFNIRLKNTGDFNITEDDEAYTTMVTNEFKMNDAYHMTLNHDGAAYTFHGFCKQLPKDAEKIDFIFLTPNIHVERSHIEYPHVGEHLSDHNPYWSDLTF